MSNVRHQVTLGTKTDTELGLDLLEKSSRPVLPKAKDRAVSIPGKAGEWRYGADVAAREWKLKFAWIGELDDDAIQVRVEELAAHLLDEQGELDEIALSFVDAPGRTWDVFYTKGLPVDRFARGAGVITLYLTAPDPWGYGTEVVTTDTITASPQAVEVENDGTVPAPCVIVITNNGGNTISGFTLTRELKP